MAFTIPNKGSAFHDNQSEFDKVDLDILVAGYAGTGVISGCAVTERSAGGPNMSVDVAAGTVQVAGTEVAVAQGNVVVTAADATNPRFDLVVVNSSGTKSVTAGTAASELGTPGPVFPAIPANSVVLAAVYVPAANTAIANNQLTDKRVLLLDLQANQVAFTPAGTIASTNVQAAIEEVASEAGGGGGGGGVLAHKSYNPGSQALITNATGSHTDVDATNLVVTFTVPASGEVLIILNAIARHSSAGENVFWGLRESTTNITPEASFGVPSTSFSQRGTTIHKITGLTPSASKTYKWSHRGATGTVTHIHGGVTAGPAVMIVLEV